MLTVVLVVHCRYINYSLATSTARRQPIVVAANIDQTKIVSGIKRGSWRTDQRIGKFQLDNAYYRNNDWDRGHLARRSAMAWGDSRGQAQAASDDTMVYTNAALQHSNFNQVRRKGSISAAACLLLRSI